MAMWNVVSRTTDLLSGQVIGIERDGAASVGEIAMIQFPKLMYARLEWSRRRFATRHFHSGSSTSYGHEDFWALSLYAAKETGELLGEFIGLMAIELEVLHSLSPQLSESVVARPVVTQFSEFDGRDSYCSFVLDNGVAPGCESAREIFPIR